MLKHIHIKHKIILYAWKLLVFHQIISSIAHDHMRLHQFLHVHFSEKLFTRCTCSTLAVSQKDKFILNSIFQFSTVETEKNSGHRFNSSSLIYLPKMMIFKWFTVSVLDKWMMFIIIIMCHFYGVCVLRNSWFAIFKMCDLIMATIHSTLCVSTHFVA